MKLDTKYFGKFAKLTATLGNNAPLSNCMHLWQCIQGHLNFHLSSTSITINGIDNLDASEILQNAANGSKIAHLSLQNMLYCIQLANKSPLFLQLSQCSSGEVDAVIPNTQEAELMAKWINAQVVAWCHFYWKAKNLGRERFYRKLLDRAFSQKLLHEISKCVWDTETMSVTLPNVQLELSAVKEFKNQDWVKNIAQVNQTNLTKKHVDPNEAFPSKTIFWSELFTGRIWLRNPTNRKREQELRMLPQSSRSLMTTMTSTCSPPRRKTNSLLSLFRRGARTSPQLVTGLPPVPHPQSAASPPTLPPPEQTGQHLLQLRDQQSPPAAVPKVGLMVGRAANSCQ
jgi:hypothetical protein